MYLLFPGRHHLLTRFQHDYLSSALENSACDMQGNPISTKVVIEAVIFAVTSANHSNTRRNPLPFYLRALMLQKFAETLPVPAFIYGIDDVGNVSNFSTYTVKRIKHDSEGMFDLNPQNTLVLCSTPVLEMYEHDGFTILPAELKSRETWEHKTLLPWDIVERIATSVDWKEDQTIQDSIHPASLAVWDKYRLANKVQVLFRDRMISEDGDITRTRDYNAYVRQMDEIATLKYEETAPHLRAGRIGDIGCAVGSWIKLATADPRFRESDFYGIEIARHLFDICQQRKHNGEFTNPFVFFSQRNAVTGLVFDRGSMNTIHTSSLTHEIESYGSRADLLDFIRNRFDELAPGGVWINRDVVGPKNKDEMVWMKLCATDGRNTDYEKSLARREALAEYLTGLSTHAKFLRFANDFRKHEGYQLSYREVKSGEDTFVELSLRDACEFMSRKDYVDNWESEMHETFCFWDFDEWKEHLNQAGFIISDNSKPYTNPWIVKNRWEGKVELYKPSVPGVRLSYPVTNMLLLAEKH